MRRLSGRCASVPRSHAPVAEEVLRKTSVPVILPPMSPSVTPEEEAADPKTIIYREYSVEWKIGDEPYYPVNDDVNNALYAKYKALADQEKNVIFGGRLGEYKYYDMDVVIKVALEKVQEVISAG